MNGTVLLTGATGFVGNHVIPELINRGHEVIATARSIEKAKACSWYPKVLFVPYDFTCVTGDNSTYHFFNEPDILIHLAWDGLPNFNDLIHIEQHLHHQYLFLKNLTLSSIEVLSAGLGVYVGCSEIFSYKKPSKIAILDRRIYFE